MNRAGNNDRRASRRPTETDSSGSAGRSNVDRPNTRSAARRQEKSRLRPGILGMSLVMAGLVLFAVYLLYVAFQLQVTEHEQYAEKAAQLHLRTVTDYPQRGSLYDRNGTLLAVNTYVSTVGVTPRDVRPWSEVGEPSPAVTAEYAAGIATALALDPAFVEQILLTKNDADGKPIEYAVIKKEASKAETEALLAYKNSMELGGIRIDVEERRYYPLGSLASQAIGFTNRGENSLVGVYGVEAFYNQELSGQPGYRYSEMENVFGGQLPFSLPTRLQAQDGYSLQLTLDTEIQRIVESAVQRSADASGLIEGGVGIVMDPNTGEVLAMGQYPSFDLNKPSAGPVGLDPDLWDPAANEEQMRHLQNALWRNRSISDTFEAGSTFKSLTTAMAFDEGLAHEQELFSDQEIIVDGWSLHCWAHPSNHGIETLEKAMWNSCNPVFVQLSQRVGIARFYQYVTAFGFGDCTGVDLPAEAMGILHASPTEIDMYTMSYGTSATVTPLQLCNAYGVLANGGRLMRPTLARALLDNEGNIIRTIQPQTIRQVVSEKTASRVTQLLEGVVTHGTGSTGYVEGYTFAAKTGTTTRRSDNRNVASYVAVAPSDNPLITVCVVLYGFSQDQVTYDTGRAAGSIISQTLEYMGVERDYSGDDVYLLKQTTEMPSLAGMTFLEARSALGALQITGVAGAQRMLDSTVVRSQSPTPGTRLHKNGIVVLYDSEQLPEDLVPIPDFTGMTVSEASRFSAQCGLNILIQGNCLGLISSQEPAAPGSEAVDPVNRHVPRGSQIAVIFEVPHEGPTAATGEGGGE